MIVKKTLLSLASIFLIYQSYQMATGIDGSLDVPWWLHVLLAVMINLFVTGVFAFAGFAFSTQKLLPEAYYRVRKPRTLKKVYRALSVDKFRKALLATFWRSPQQRGKYFDGTKAGVENLDRQSRKSEFGHLLPLAFITLISIRLIIVGAFAVGIFALLINVVFNLYPIILQRHHRMRIQVYRRRYLDGKTFDL
ncbi:glycosyl-4,4'-diaponeurosporenoate acyltransferase CrtO family protein [Neolewinella antarctica]|uniref:Glycosyl-4,4'-diaponeurosporenoate acyltransferase n=1 Tax=Neolewinella antarctica TaxID=442734 RepID=A0ABX0X8W1_9BACT|nr:hypothetical protein [Neolewinella antarctica]NJC25704.1 hypothetical protein [Neolewinella antarctica]